VATANKINPNKQGGVVRYRSVLMPIFAATFLGALAWSGWYILDYSEINPPTPPRKTLTGAPKVIFGIHLALWLILGMFANYLWDIFRSGKSWNDITWRELFLPVLVSPIVFFSIWSIWKGDPTTFALPLIAFQNGFFWQVVFSKAGTARVPPGESSGAGGR